MPADPAPMPADPNSVPAAAEAADRPADADAFAVGELPREPIDERFGLRLAGTPIVFPAGEALEFLPETRVYPLPFAPERLIGLMQLRGHPLAVFDPRENAEALPPGTAPAVLVVGVPPRAAALLVDEAPHAVRLVAASSIRTAAAGGDAALLRDGDGTVWREVDPQRYFEALAADTPQDRDR